MHAPARVGLATGLLCTLPLFGAQMEPMLPDVPATTEMRLRAVEARTVAVSPLLSGLIGSGGGAGLPAAEPRDSKWDCGRSRGIGKVSVTVCTWHYVTGWVKKTENIQNAVEIRSSARDRRDVTIRWDEYGLSSLPGPKLRWTYRGYILASVPPGLTAINLGDRHTGSLNDAEGVRASIQYRVRGKKRQPRSANSSIVTRQASTEK